MIPVALSVAYDKERDFANFTGSFIWDLAEGENEKIRILTRLLRKWESDQEIKHPRAIMIHNATPTAADFFDAYKTDVNKYYLGMILIAHPVRHPISRPDIFDASGIGDDLAQMFAKKGKIGSSMLGDILHDFDFDEHLNKARSKINRKLKAKLKELAKVIDGHILDCLGSKPPAMMGFDVV